MSHDAVASLRRLAGSTAAEARSLPIGMWGLLLALATETALFAALLSSYFWLRWQTDGGWPPDAIPDPGLLRPSLVTGALVLSVLPMALAQRGAVRGSQARLRAGLLAAIAIGLAFLGLQIWDWVEKLKELTPQRNAYASLVYLLTGAHVVHVVFGLLLAGWVAARALRGAYGPGRRLGVTVAAAYWYWAVAVGVAVYVAVVITPRW